MSIITVRNFDGSYNIPIGDGTTNSIIHSEIPKIEEVFLCGDYSSDT